MSSNRPRSAELHPGPGFRIRFEYDRMSPEECARFLRYEVPDISDSLNRLFALDSAIQCQNSSRKRLVGSVCTVRVFPGDNLMVHKALDICKPGDVIVVDGHGHKSTNAVLGDIICTKAKHRGIAGFVVDGLVRDMPTIDELGFPVFARGTTAVGPLHRGPGEINYPISCGGVVVNPGDVLVADESGIVVVPLLHAESVLSRLASQSERMSAYLESVRKGIFSNQWVDDILLSHDCPIARGQE